MFFFSVAVQAEATEVAVVAGATEDHPVVEAVMVAVAVATEEVEVATAVVAMAAVAMEVVVEDAEDRQVVVEDRVEVLLVDAFVTLTGPLKISLQSRKTFITRMPLYPVAISTRSTSGCQPIKSLSKGVESHGQFSSSTSVLFLDKFTSYCMENSKSLLLSSRYLGQSL